METAKIKFLVAPVNFAVEQVNKIHRNRNACTK